MHLLSLSVDFDVVFIFLLDRNNPIIIVLTLKVDEVNLVDLEKT